MALTAQLAWEKAEYFSKCFLFRLVVKIRLKMKETQFNVFWELFFGINNLKQDCSVLVAGLN